MALDLKLVLAFFVSLVLWAVYSHLRPSKTHQLPPGPPGEPIIGHLRIVPTGSPEFTYARWSKEYGSDVLYVNMLGQHVVVLNSVQAAVDLLDKRGANYCDRPRFVLFEVMGWSGTLTFLRWGPRFQMHRKLLQSSFTKPRCVQYQDLQITETRRLIKSIIADPGNWEVLLRRFATAIVLGIGFGVTITSDNDPYIQMAIDASYALGHGGAPAGTPVDFFPFLRYLPNWLARSKSLKFARDWRWAIKQIHEVPFAAVQREMKEGSARPSFIRTQLENRAAKAGKGEKTDMTLDDIQGAAGAVYAAGQDTTWSTAVVFVLNMVLHPEIQRRAQAEIDAVVGPDRLPAFNDRPSLPYVDYILQETLRQVAPSIFVSLDSSPAIQMGARLANRSFVYANARAMCHDESTYKDPAAFNPMRFAPTSEGGNGEPLPVGQFGFGRRHAAICPGRHLADASLWIVMATMLATLSIDKTLGPDGNEITPTIALTPGLTRYP
ncbi:hypothetical protein EW146_g1637 [Bondarzewia mesenterica]|uniref:Cytochrome P450 n=1 Tax=Bondarzewia mesenterica TaxID=1095465 RepID=A0A4S4M331_9AGAM|nr:hypothetical protein EW146_g1637 [Bondarzewia mesenterica]